MNVLQERLDALQKQSKEQITGVITALQEAHREGVQAVRMAVAIGNRLTSSQIASSFPVICLIDAMAAMNDQECMAPVLEELWRISLPLFAGYAEAEVGLREKVERAVQRWGNKRYITQPVCKKLLEAMKGVKDGGEDREANIRAQGGTEAKGSLEPQVETEKVQQGRFTRTEASGFCAILQSCMKMIERLPPHRASMYMSVAIKEMGPHMPTKQSLLFFQGLHAELGRELAVYKANVVKSEHQTTTPEGDGPSTEALSNLMDKLSREDGSTLSLLAGDGKEHAFHVVRYTTPLQSDTCQRLSLARRSGFGEWHRRPKNEYHYPKKETNTRRAFRAPAGGGTLVRAWFPSAEQWIGEADMALMSLVREKDPRRERDSSSVYAVVRKRDRDGN
uniref:Uncharacterized protein n=1 Tax=Trypanosoma congolense (strain IL3000) TaxID=1068625 RepID=G0UVH4_TRYCI|nr:conserved hypothetical protein [Trypanosoma congolense IL3000]